MNRQTFVTRKRQKALASGQWAETFALLYLMAKGYRPLSTRYGGKGGEIDLVVKRGKVIVFVEVKRREHMDDARISITPNKQRLMRRTIHRWLAHHPPAPDTIIRIDAIFLARRRWPVHVENIFTLEAGEGM